MAQRLATHYVKTCLMLSEEEMSGFIQMLDEQKVLSRVKVLENGSQEVVFAEEGNGEVSFTFDHVAGMYVCRGTCRLTSPKLTNLMRKAISTYKAEAVVHRQYTNYTMIYYYKHGSVIKIIEQKGDQEQLVYEYKDTRGQLEELFLRKEVEREIRTIQEQVDQLLDLRNESAADNLKHVVDERLAKLTRRLFELEA